MLNLKLQEDKTMLPTFKNSANMPTLMDRFFNDYWFDNLWNENNPRFSPSVNITENEKSFHVELAAPGIEKKDFQVNVEDNRLVIAYEHKTETEEKKDDSKYLRREFASSSFSKSFTLPENVEPDKIAASYENGILKVEIPKAKEKSKLMKLINIS